MDQSDDVCFEDDYDESSNDSMGYYWNAHSKVGSSSRLLNDFDDFSLIARGGCGVVFKATNKTDGKEYAIKFVCRGQIDDALKEVKIHAELNHCCVVNYKTCWIESSLMLKELLESSSQQGSEDCSSEECASEPVLFENWPDQSESNDVSFEDSKTIIPEDDAKWNDPDDIMLIIQMELGGQTLQEWLDNPRPSDISRELWFTYRRLRVLMIFWEVMNGIEHIHLKGIVHHDIKPANILVMQGLGIKIGDFGLSCRGERGANIHPGLGTELYADPQQYKHGLCSSKCDIYSAGLILLEMLLSPFDTISERHDVLQSAKHLGKIPSMISSELCDLIGAMIDADLERRPSASETKDLLVTLMIPIAEEIYSELMKAMTSAIVSKLNTSDPTTRAGPVSGSAAFMLNILDDLTAIGFIKQKQNENAQNTAGLTCKEMQRQKELEVKVMLLSKICNPQIL
ncbi:eukaryotic translation initiation factor 2-alpha kinase 1-like [Cloeon dipterum]|uniref:eukaryotic translation initiation factor 2-alpha kinase 1-like n=1 Tax=Cloeon dipterum TaxID=197152 RepID=UPI00321FA6B6